MKQPQDFRRRILVAVTGLTPQIVTETLYALAVKQAPRFIPTEVRLITTEEGADRAELSLLHRKSGWFHRLRADYDLPPITFEAKHIRVLKDEDGRPLGDIRSPEDNERAADTITTVLRDLASDDDSALHVSIAGGRKTMGFYLGYALSLYGREQDRLSHVLVNAPYEGHPDFFYPTPESKLIHTREPNSRPYDTKEAKVALADIPFVRMGLGSNDELIEGKVSFSAAVADRQRALPPLALRLDPASCMVTAGGESFRLPPALFALYWMLAERARRGDPGVHPGEEGVIKERFGYYSRVQDPESEEYQRSQEAHLGKDGIQSESAEGQKLSEFNFNPDKSKIRRKLKEHLGSRRAEPYQITKQDRVDLPGQVTHRYGLTLRPEEIHISTLAER